MCIFAVDFERKSNEALYLRLAVRNLRNFQPALIINKSDIIESLFGYYKGRKSPDKQAGITCSALVIPLRTVIGTQDSQLDDKIMRIFPTETVNTVARWRKETIGESNLSLRLATFRKTG